ncbi:MAG: aspartate aminotransferase family protein [Bacteroidales bacterium]|nr:aspartate aminotransferase family protein [Bacteroidales bacterium]
MIDSKAFRRYAHEFADWMADYLETVEALPVKPNVRPGDIFSKIPDQPPMQGESMSAIFGDFKQIILPGMTHWQSPNYFAYFTANSSYPSVLAEMLTATMGAQCMVWETSPAAAELEEKVMHWLRTMIGLPDDFEGVIQDSASSATLAALLSAREKASSFRINEAGFQDNRTFRIYCSTEAHSSIEKGVKIAGFGRKNLVKVGTDAALALDPGKLKEAIERDLSGGLTPLCVVVALGTTGTSAIDPLKPIAAICKEYGLWLHVDAAYAGTALVLPEYRKMIKGIEEANSFVFNPHKWMFTNFDCSAYFVKEPETLIHTFEILPEYLKTGTRGEVNDYRDWGVQLGRRFRALKLWFVIRDYGLEGIRTKVRNHIAWANELAEEIRKENSFTLFEPQNLGLVCFRYTPSGFTDKEKLNDLNNRLMKSVNDSGRIYLSHTKVDGWIILRMVVGQTNVTREHVMGAWQLLREKAEQLIDR